MVRVLGLQPIWIFARIDRVSSTQNDGDGSDSTSRLIQHRCDCPNPAKSTATDVYSLVPGHDKLPKNERFLWDISHSAQTISIQHGIFIYLVASYVSAIGKLVYRLLSALHNPNCTCLGE